MRSTRCRAASISSSSFFEIAYNSDSSRVTTRRERETRPNPDPLDFTSGFRRTVEVSSTLERNIEVNIRIENVHSFIFLSKLQRQNIFSGKMPEENGFDTTCKGQIWDHFRVSS